MNWYIVGSYVVTFAALGLEVFFLMRRARKVEAKT
jgi:hypothetical protein